MKKFNYTPNGYNPEEVNAFLDDVIKQVERIISSNKKKEEEIINLKKQVNDLTNMKATEEVIAKAKKFDELNDTLTEAINMARNTGERMRNVAKQERNLILQDAKNNADIIIRDALEKSNRIQFQAEMIRRNIVSFKKKMKINLEEQIKLIDDIEIIDIENK
ncbi:MAG: DivIVA domain-containing protein [Bacilli bacterium]|nr:DivIVA domain-containing protein [Bacilli bacterium]